MEQKSQCTVLAGQRTSSGGANALIGHALNSGGKRRGIVGSMPLTDSLEMEPGKRKLRVWCLTHVPFEGPEVIEEWALERGHEFQLTRLWADGRLPVVEDIDLLVVMGGPMSVHDESEFTWLRVEKALVRACLDRGRFVLGVCLGSQILAECLGATVRGNECREIGWFPIQVTPEGGSLLEGLPGELMVFHWHGETYDLPSGTALRAASAGCAVQAFEHPLALGLQFHMEVMPEGVERLLAHCAHEIGHGPYEQSPTGIREGHHAHGEGARRSMLLLMDRIAGRVAGDHAK